MRGLSLREYLASFVTAPGIISLLMFLVFGAMPLSSRYWRGCGAHLIYLSKASEELMGSDRNDSTVCKKPTIVIGFER